MSSSEALRPATCSRDPGLVLYAEAYRTAIDRFEPREKAAERRLMNGHQTLVNS